MKLDTESLKNYIKATGIKQKHISEKTGIPEPVLSGILQGKRKCEVGEYASICAELEIPIEKFIIKDYADNKAG